MTEALSQYTEPHFKRSAMITIDVQNDFTFEGAPAYVEGTMDVVDNVRRLLACFRKNVLPIFHVIRLYLPDASNVELCRKQLIESGCSMLAPNTMGAELVDVVKPNEQVRLDSNLLMSGDLQKIGDNEFIIYKSRWGAFYKTQLEQYLAQLNVDTLIFTGCNFPNCPRTSIYEASERDYRIVLVKDALSKVYAQGLEEMRSIGVNVVDTRELEFVLKNMKI